MKKLYAYCQKRLQDLIINSVVKPHAQYGLNPTWTNNNAECINHVLKQSVDWKKKSSLQLIKVLERLLFLQVSHMTRVLFGCGDFALAESWKSYYSISKNAWFGRAAVARRRKVSNFWLYGQPSPSKTTKSLDGKLKLHYNPWSGKKPDQKKGKPNSTRSFKNHH